MRTASLLLLALAWLLIAANKSQGAEPTMPMPHPAMADSAGQPWASELGDTLQLEDVLRRVIARNPSLAVARAASNEARARSQGAGALDDPMLELMAAPRSFGSASVDAGYSISLRQAFPLFGQRGLRRQAADAEGKMAAADLGTAQLDLIHEAKLMFAEFWQIHRAVTVNRDLYELLVRFRRVSLSKYTAGLVGEQDPLQADTELAMLDHQSVVLERQRQAVRAQLNVLMHDPVVAELPPPPSELALPDTAMAHAELSSGTPSLRPELQAADARVAAAQANLTLAHRQRLPEMSFSVGYDHYWSEPELRPNVGIMFNLPINFGRLAAAETESRARLEGSEAARDVVRDSIAVQIEVARSRLHELAHDVLISRGRLVPLAERTLSATRAGYEANRSDFLSLLNSVRDLLRARLEADGALAMLVQAQADLDRATGLRPAVLEKEGQP